jgi:putative tricarboxylic transport membrane protein
VLEENLRRALSISGGDWGILFNGPMAYTLAGATAAALLVPGLWRWYKKPAKTGVAPDARLADSEE